MSQIIDMRCRPAFLHDFFGKTPGTPEYDTVRWLNRRVGTRGNDEHFTRSSTQEGFLTEVRDAGLKHAVIVGRHTPSQHLPNDTIHSIVANESVLAKVAQAFPNLQIVAYHGYWPNVQQVIGIAFRYQNVHLVPDMYLFQPGGGAYVEAINSFLADQFLFGSSYPFRPIRQTIDDFLQLGIREDALERVLHGNAERLLKL